ncbi:MAG: hypothetical protein GY913_32025 [Proteobacteria bacterium]|nr:hypothetical protein [Pseudomonadota bacterium]
MTLLSLLACRYGNDGVLDLQYCDDPTSLTASPVDREVTWYADAEPIVAAKCGACHADGEAAPFPLTTYADVEAMAQPVYEAVVRGEMPLRTAAERTTPRTAASRRTSSTSSWAGSSRTCRSETRATRSRWRATPADYWFAEPTTLAPGEELYIECTWMNPYDDLSWETDQEMCSGAVYVSETGSWVF